MSTWHNVGRREEERMRKKASSSFAVYTYTFPCLFVLCESFHVLTLSSLLSDRNLHFLGAPSGCLCFLKLNQA